jgi:ferritin-like metal-binding protein YciE
LNQKQVDELLYQGLETELGGVQIYRAAVECAVNEELKEEWTKYGTETEHHVEIMQQIFEQLGLDPEAQTPGRKVVHHLGESLVQAMQQAKAEGTPEAAELVAAECVVLAETKDHQNWELIGRILEDVDKKHKDVLQPAFEEVESQEDEHLYHTRGWARELWIQSLGMPAVLPPPEEQKKVETMIGAARAEQQRDQML